MHKIVIAVDSFKGSLSSREVAAAVAEGVGCVCPECQMVQVSLADGGEGTCQALVETLGGEMVEVEVHDPLMRPIKASYGVVDRGATAVIEMATASGLPLVRPEERDALRATTYGTGELIAAALERGCRRFLIGIGGSATTDGGVGMLAALGYRFYDAQGQEIAPYGGIVLEQIVKIDGSQAHPALRESKFVVACDVTNPLSGATGAAYVFAPQKGASVEMVEQLDRGLVAYGRLLEQYSGYAVAEQPGAGAAGGMGAGLCGVLGAEMHRGVDMVLDAVSFDSLIEGADLVITGEGRIDRQTLMGKAPQGVLLRARRQGIPVVAIGGGVLWCEELASAESFDAIFPIVAGPITLEEAMCAEVARQNVCRTAMQIARMMSIKKQ